MARSGLAAVLALCLLARGICYPHTRLRKRATEGAEQTTITDVSTNTLNQSPPSDETPVTANEIVPPASFDEDNDDDEFEPMMTSSSGDGSNVLSLLRIAGAILPSFSNANILLRNIIRHLIELNRPLLIRRQFIDGNEIEIDHTNELKSSPFQRQKDNSVESNNVSRNETNESVDTTEEIVENLNRSNSKEDSDPNDASVDDNNSGYDSDEPPGGGDGQGGGILGLLAGLSGGEDGQSDLGSLLAAVSGIVANLSADGIDLNALIASGIGLFVGLLSEGEENPGAVLASYLLTSLDTISGGGSKNNGAFFGTFLSKLVKGTSAVQSEGEATSPFYTLKLDILRALVQFGTSLLGLASSSVFSSSG